MTGLPEESMRRIQGISTEQPGTTVAKQVSHQLPQLAP